MMARLDDKLVDVQIMTPETLGSIDSASAVGQSVHLIVEEGLEAFLPMADMIDYVKERVSPDFIYSSLPFLIPLHEVICTDVFLKLLLILSLTYIFYLYSAIFFTVVSFCFIHFRFG